MYTYIQAYKHTMSIQPYLNSVDPSANPSGGAGGLLQKCRKESAIPNMEVMVNIINRIPEAVP